MEPFRQAASHFTDLLFVVAAGDDGRDVDEQPVWPAGFRLPNFLVVTTWQHPSQPENRPNRGQRTVEAYTMPYGTFRDGDRAFPTPNTSGMAAMQVADILAGCWPKLIASSRGEALKNALLAEAVRPWPGLPAARATAVCKRGRPATRTNCLADPNRLDAPAARTMACKPSPGSAAPVTALQPSHDRKARAP